MELRFTTTNGTPVANFTIAVDRPKRRKGEQEADFIPIVAYGKLAENCANHIGKGRLVGVSGRIQTRSYKAQNGTRYVTEIIADEVQFLDRSRNYASANNEYYPEEDPF